MKIFYIHRFFYLILTPTPFTLLLQPKIEARGAQRGEKCGGLILYTQYAILFSLLAEFWINTARAKA